MNPELGYRVHTSPHLVPVLCQLNLIHVIINSYIVTYRPISSQRLGNCALCYDEKLQYTKILEILEYIIICI
jgi:hypothetical protein